VFLRGSHTDVTWRSPIICRLWIQSQRRLGPQRSEARIQLPRTLREAWQPLVLVALEGAVTAAIVDPRGQPRIGFSFGLTPQADQWALRNYRVRALMSNGLFANRSEWHDMDHSLLGSGIVA